MEKHGLLILVLAVWPVETWSQSVNFSPEIALEGRTFFQEPQFPDQFNSFQGGLILSGNARWTSADRSLRLVFEPYLRWDSEDDERTYGDIRELSLAYRRGAWDLFLGVGQVFWGVAESRNVVDVINQFDTLEDFDQGEKLGQPMVRIANRSTLGTFELYYLPYFRAQNFPGSEGRLRFGPVVDTERAEYARAGEAWAGELALRYAHRFGDLDLGLHLFDGTDRQPIIRVDPEGLRGIPFYPERKQAGVDLQYTRGPWLLKKEAVWAEVSRDSFFSTVAGLEFTFFDVARLGFDLGVIAEYLYDNRDLNRSPLTLFEDDLFAGFRVTLNDVQDTELLLGAIVDRRENAIIGSVEWQRRLGSRALLEIEGRYLSAGRDPLISPLAEDSHLTLRLTRYF